MTPGLTQYNNQRKQQEALIEEIDSLEKKYKQFHRRWLISIFAWVAMFIYNIIVFLEGKELP